MEMYNRQTDKKSEGSDRRVPKWQTKKGVTGRYTHTCNITLIISAVYIVC